MKGRKRAVWAVIICATFITAGLILSCGDDDGDGTSAKCQRACERFDECGWIGPDGEFGETVAECIDGCKEETADLTADELEELVQCIENTPCEDIMEDCDIDGDGAATCQTVCEKMINECGWDMGENVAECAASCEENRDHLPQSMLDCIVGTSCANIADDCLLGCADACGNIEDCELLGAYGYADWDQCLAACDTDSWSDTLIDCFTSTDCAEMIGACVLP